MSRTRRNFRPKVERFVPIGKPAEESGRGKIYPAHAILAFREAEEVDDDEDLEERIEQLNYILESRADNE